MRVDNAIILAAGCSSRFAPLSYETHKAFTVVRDEVLIERQIKQLLSAGIPSVIIITGYKSEQFDYLKNKYGVELIHNNDYSKRNNNGSIWAARNVIGNSYICSSDNYFVNNPFNKLEDEAFYSAVYAEGHTEEWCITEDSDGYINSITVGGCDKWYMYGHAFWDNNFSERYLSILEKEYELSETLPKLWEQIYIEHLDVLKLKVNKHDKSDIFEFDSIDELRQFDNSYTNNTRSEILKNAAKILGINEAEIVHINPLMDKDSTAYGFEFDCGSRHFKYKYNTGYPEES